MQRLFYPEITNGGLLHSYGVGEINSVENGQPDNGALACGAAHFWNCMRHNTTKELVANFLSRLAQQSGNLNVDAHGNVGLLANGGGQLPNWTKDEVMADWNSGQWISELAPLKGKAFPILSIYACDTGAAQDGADLLFYTANAIGQPVRARTGIVTCGDAGVGFSGGTWQVAYPGTTRPTPIPQTDKMEPRRAQSDFFYITSLGLHFRKEDVSQARIERMRPNRIETVHAGREAASFVEMIMLYPEVDIGGQPLAILTGRLSIIVISNNHEVVAKFAIYNDRIIMAESSTIARIVPKSLIRSII